MLTDKLNTFSDDQAITASAASTNIVDLGEDLGLAYGSDGPELVVQVTEAFNNLTSLAVALRTSASSDMSSPVDLVVSTALLATLTAGARINNIAIPPGVLQYVQIYYTVVGTAPTTGTVFAGFVFNSQTN